jgi:diadenosine tetraphosphate (Ap4A) HIT family hydrolase
MSAPATDREPGCPLCEGAGGRLVFQAPAFRVIHAEEVGFPAFYRVVWQAHAREFTDLSSAERAQCMAAVACVEQCLREGLAPTKINLAALGNAVPHLHWHVIARFDWDSHFPGAVWAGAQRQAPAERLRAVADQLPAVEAVMARRLAECID